MSAIEPVAASAIDLESLWGACRMESADCEAFGVEAIADMLRRAPFTGGRKFQLWCSRGTDRSGSGIADRAQWAGDCAHLAGRGSGQR